MHASVCARVCLGISPSHPGMRASALAGGPGGSHRPPPGPICPRVAPQSSVETSVWGRAGTVELPDVSSRGEASSAVNFSFDPQEELLVKVPLYLVKGHTHTHKITAFISLLFSQEASLSHKRRCCSGCEGVRSLTMTLVMPSSLAQRSILQGLLTFGFTVMV